MLLNMWTMQILRAVSPATGPAFTAVRNDPLLSTTLAATIGLRRASSDTAVQTAHYMHRQLKAFVAQHPLRRAKRARAAGGERTRSCFLKCVQQRKGMRSGKHDAGCQERRHIPAHEQHNKVLALRLYLQMVDEGFSTQCMHSTGVPLTRLPRRP